MIYQITASVLSLFLTLYVIIEWYWQDAPEWLYAIGNVVAGLLAGLSFVSAIYWIWS